MTSIVKRRPDAPPGFFDAEAAGLAWLGAAEAQGGVRVARVLRVTADAIEVERIPAGDPTPDAAAAFGSALARTHDAGAAAFGSAPDGWTGPLWIGRREQPRTTHASWGRFYAEARVRPFLAAAVASGNLAPDAADEVDAVCEVIAAGAFDDDDAPARLHGDLWNGNVLWSPSGAVLIDPAAHGGHRETDLAMLALFGCPHLDRVVAGYDTVHPLRDGWRSRIPLHQLHPLAVHAAGHGPSYGVALLEAARAVRALR